jgi:hypothetical protein
MKTVIEIHKLLKESFTEYHKEHRTVNFRQYLTDVLQYSDEEATVIMVENEHVLYPVNNSKKPKRNRRREWRRKMFEDKL